MLLLGVLEKNPMIEDWFLLEDCFLRGGAGRAGVASLSLAMIDVDVVVSLG